MSKPLKFAIVTSGGSAPCLNASLASLIAFIGEKVPASRISCYPDGYAGLVAGAAHELTVAERAHAGELAAFGGSAAGTSRYQPAVGTSVVEQVANRLAADDIDVLFLIGGDGTQMLARNVREHLALTGGRTVLLGLPKTIDNDLYPVALSLGASTAVVETAAFFDRIVAEATAGQRALVVHQVMGRHSGWLAARSAYEYHERLLARPVPKWMKLGRELLGIDAVYVPEVPVDIQREVARLREVMDRKGAVNVFIAEGVGALVRADGGRTQDVSAGTWIAHELADGIGADRHIVERSGYHARSAPAGDEDCALIRASAELAVTAALNGQSGVVGLDEEHQGTLRLIDYGRIRGGKPFDPRVDWFQGLLGEIKQGHVSPPRRAPAAGYSAPRAGTEAPAPHAP